MTEQLWAPWRLKYIEAAGKSSGCIFCSFAEQDASHDAANLVVYRGETAYMILNAYPYSNGHLMVIPYRHTATLEDYADAEMLEIMRLTRLGTRLLNMTFYPDACNLGVNMGRAAGAGIPDHLHWHIVPRWNGDTNFMTVLGEVRVIPESLEVVYERLTANLSSALAAES